MACMYVMEAVTAYQLLHATSSFASKNSFKLHVCRTCTHHERQVIKFSLPNTVSCANCWCCAQTQYSAGENSAEQL